MILSLHGGATGGFRKFLNNRIAKRVEPFLAVLAVPGGTYRRAASAHAHAFIGAALLAFDRRLSSRFELYSS